MLCLDIRNVISHKSKMIAGFQGVERWRIRDERFLRQRKVCLLLGIILDRQRYDSAGALELGVLGLE